MKASAIPISPGGRVADRDPDLRHVRSAIDLIISGAARRVTLVGLEGAERLLPQAQALSAKAGLTARAVRQPGGAGLDIAVEEIR